MINFLIMMRVSLYSVIEMLVPKKSLLELRDIPLKSGHKEILSQKTVTIEITENMDKDICTNHPPIIEGTLTTLNDEMVVVEVKVPTTPSSSGYYPKTQSSADGGLPDDLLR